MAVSPVEHFIFLHVDLIQTNPSLVYAAARLPEYKALVDDAVAYGKKHGAKGAELTELVLDKVSETRFG